ncbi:hypothetical protein ZOSMA_179G00260 [Zostera marina]|uniref:Uncharacterized protein n=1 Tax=Zostera marina TaxID=29655 RepID=A0A0K9PTQ7_ZOSMR|nr:hypothetical protein ZOSMA_179G00260 [Zostera marina]
MIRSERAYISSVRGDGAVYDGPRLEDSTLLQCNRRARVGSSRFVEAIHYYSALFNSLGASYSEESHERQVVEQQRLAREIRNVQAVGGPARTGEVKFTNWREKLRHPGFRSSSLAGNVATQASLLLGMFPCDGYTLVEENGTLKLG